MRLRAPFRAAGDHIAAELERAHVLFTTRRGGVSRGPFASLNLGRWTDDDPGCVDANRARVAAAVGVAPERLAHGRQVHGTDVERRHRAPDPRGKPAPADGQAASLRDVVPMVLVADCLPIALAADGAVAMVHAGWRGLAGGVVEEGMAALRDLGASGPVEAAIGPGAGGCCYEVGREVLEAFADHPEAVVGGDPGRLDLKAIADARLRAAGVEVVHDVGLCTMCSDASLFFSHRRDCGVTGRQAGMVWRR